MIIRNEKELDYLLKDLEKYSTFALDTEYVDRGYPNVHFVGTSFAFKEGNNYHGYYIPLGHNTLEPQLDKKETMDKLRPYLEDETKLKIFHNAKADFKSYGLQDVFLYDSRYFRWAQNPIGKPPEYSDINTETQFWDTMIASWLLQMDREHKLKTLSKELLGEEMTELSDLATKESKTGVLRVDLVPIKDLGEYAWHDAIQTYKLYEHFKPQIEAEYHNIYYDLELPFVKVVTEMETQGSDIDEELLVEMGEKIRVELEILRNQLYELVGEEFNINSTKQLSKILFTTLKLEPIGEENKKGDYCTDVNILVNFNKRYKEYLSGEKPENKKYEIAATLLRYRKLKKLLGTYIDGLLKQIVDGKLYSNFWQLGTRTGRLSSSNPNFQNIPTSKEFPIRKIFKIPNDEWVWGTLDYNQLELRIVTHVSQDKTLLKVYQENGDVHSQVTKDCFNLPCEVHEVKEKYGDMRRKGKQVSFGKYTCRSKTHSKQGKLTVV